MSEPPDATSLAPATRAAVGRATAPVPAGETRRVDLVWRDPVTGAELTLDLEASPALIEGLRAAGFEAAAPEGGSLGPRAA